MPDNNRFQFYPALFMPGAFVAGTVCTRWIPANWFPNVLGCSVLAALILAIFAGRNTNNERQAPTPLTVILEALWLPSRNAEIRTEPVLWMCLGMFSFVAGMLVSALLMLMFAVVHSTSPCILPAVKKSARKHQLADIKYGPDFLLMK